MIRIPRATPPFSAIAVALLLGGCATVPGQDRLAEKDPLEKFNRKVWAVNQAADKVVIKPASSVYRTVTPKPARQGVSNFFANLTEPWSFVNNLLQAKPGRAARNLGRFLVNTTAGIGGLFDVAGKTNIRPAPEDFGQTLARWGVNGGPYLVLPLLGPSTLRDGIGSAVAWGADPINIGLRELDPSTPASLAYRGMQIVSIRSDLTDSGADAFLKSSLDPYAAARSAYLQRHKAAVLNQEDSFDAGPPDDDQPAAGQPAGEAVPNPAGAPQPDAPAAAAPAPSGEPAPAQPAPEPTAPRQ